MTVQQHLDASWQAHTRYRASAGMIHGHGHAKAGEPKSLPDYPKTLQACQDALTHREQAHALDPDHRDPAWKAEKVSHADMVRFYTKYITETEAFFGPLPAPVKVVELPAEMIDAKPCEPVKIDG